MPPDDTASVPAHGRPQRAKIHHIRRTLHANITRIEHLIALNRKKIRGLQSGNHVRRHDRDTWKRENESLADVADRLRLFAYRNDKQWCESRPLSENRTRAPIASAAPVLESREHNSSMRYKPDSIVRRLPRALSAR